MKNSSQPDQTLSLSPNKPGLLQNHPLSAYFLLAFAWSWIWQVIFLGVLQLPPDVTEIVLIPAAFGPALSALLLVALTEGKAGVLNFLRRFLLWRVPFRWYLLVLIGLPVLILLCFFCVPGAMGSFQAPVPAFALNFLVGYIAILLLGGPLGEEPGWRGFALPRLQKRYGPLVGSLVLGVFWGLWHLPAFFLIPGYNGAGSDFVGIMSAIVSFVIAIMALAVIYTWVSNNTRSSLLLAILFHASFNTSGSLFAGFFSPAVSESLLAQVIEELVFVGVALIIVVATQGRLSYQRFLHETEPLIPGSENTGEIQ
jgi:uncharacterized protein